MSAIHPRDPVDEKLEIVVQAIADCLGTLKGDDGSPGKAPTFGDAGYDVTIRTHMKVTQLGSNLLRELDSRGFDGAEARDILKSLACGFDFPSYPRNR